MSTRILLRKIGELEVRLIASLLRDHSVRPTHVHASGQSLSSLRALNQLDAECLIDYTRRVLIEEVCGPLSKVLRPQTTPTHL